MKWTPLIWNLKTICLIVFPLILSTTQYAHASTPTLKHDIREEVLRIFMMKRLEKAIALIERLDKRGVFPKLCAHISGPTCAVLDDDTDFSHEEIIQCKRQIERKKSLKPFLMLWKNIQKTPTNPTVFYLKDVALLILKIYKAIYTVCSPVLPTMEPINKNLAFQALGLLFGNIAHLQAFELLSIIEKLTVQIPKLLEKYEITTGNLTWKQWIVKYWWLPPMAISAIVLECAFMYQVAIGAKKLPPVKSAISLFSKENKEAPCNT